MMRQRGTTAAVVMAAVLAVVGCATTGAVSDLAKVAEANDTTRFLIAGDNLSQADVDRYFTQYGGLMRETPSSSPIADLTRSVLTVASGGVSPAYLKTLVADLRAIGESGKEWEIIVLERARRALLLALQQIEDGGLSKASGVVRLVGFDEPDIDCERAVQSAAGGGFQVLYESADWRPVSDRKALGARPIIPNAGTGGRKFVPLNLGATKFFWVAGTYQKGRSNVTEPRPQSSRYLATQMAGAVVIDRGVGLFLNAKVREHPVHPLYIRITYPNPLNPKEPFVNDMQFAVDAEEFRFSSPNVICGLVGYEDYDILVEIFEDETAQNRVDVLKQQLRCYVDTATDQVLVWSGLKTE